MAATMKAWQFTSVATTLEAALTLNPAAPAPDSTTLAANEILVEVISVALNPVDYKMPEMALVGKLMYRGGAHTPALDFSGRVVAAGSSVPAATYAPGTLVFGTLPPSPPPRFGALGQLLVATPAACVPVPAGVPADDAATVGVAGLTALQSLLVAGAETRPGSRVLVNGGSGGTGTFAIQLAKALGAAHVTATCSAANADLCRALGADEVLDYRAVDVVEALKAGGKGAFDLVVDNVGNPELRLYENAGAYLKEGGVFVQVGAPASLGGFKTLVGRAVTPRWLGGGDRAFTFLTMKGKPEDLTRIGEFMKEGKVKAVIDQTFEFEDVPKAYEKLKLGRTKGKIVVHVGK